MELRSNVTATDSADESRNAREAIPAIASQRSGTACKFAQIAMSRPGQQGAATLQSWPGDAEQPVVDASGQRLFLLSGDCNCDSFCCGDCDTVSEHMKPTRRGFLAAGAAAPALIASIHPAVEALAQNTRSTLQRVMDLIIPASDGMPSASEAGGLTYLERLMQHDKDAAADITKALSVADAFSERSFQKSFGDLEKNDQITVLKEMENSALGVFDALRAYVYESYYEQPAIWRLIGYELYPTDHTGPHLAPFDDSLVANVRKMPKLYRDV